jgi:hypothetical protein
MGSRRGIFTEKSTGLAKISSAGRPLCNISERNYVDNECNTPQYLVVGEMPMQHLGDSSQLGPALKPFKGKSFTEENFMPAKKKAKKKKKH